MLLKEVCEFRNGKAHEQYVDPDGQYILVTSKFISSDGKLYRRTNQQMTPLFRGDICMVMSDVPNGKALAKCFLVDEDNKYTLNQRIGSFTVDNRFDKKYFYYLMNRNKYFLSFNDGNGQTNLRKDDILKFTFDYIPIEDQHSIVQKLDKLKEIIEKRQHELQTFDELIKARFVEMFGDPVINSKGLETTNFESVVKLQRGFDLPVQSRNEEGNVPVIGSNGIVGFHDTAKVIGAGVVTGRSGTIGNVYYTASDYWPLNTSLFSVDLHNNNAIYLSWLLRLFDLSRFADGTGVPTLNRNNVHNKQIIDVPIELQSKFADFVQEVDKSKVVVQKALDEAQILFDSLMQQYFG